MAEAAFTHESQSTQCRADNGARLCVDMLNVQDALSDAGTFITAIIMSARAIDDKEQSDALAYIALEARSILQEASAAIKDAFDRSVSS